MVKNELSELEQKERQAIELRFIGYTYEDIAERVGLNVGTLQNWFKAGGKLIGQYKTFKRRMNALKDRGTLNEYIETDESMAIVTTNVIRQFAQQVKTSGNFLMIVTKDGESILDKDGNKQIMKFSKKLTTQDLERAFRIQRILSNKHTDSIKLGFQDENELRDMVDRAREIFGSRADDIDDLGFKKESDETRGDAQGSGTDSETVQG